MVATTQLAKQVLPPAARTALKRSYRRVTGLRLGGKGVECPCCGGRFREFKRGGVNARANALCQDCGAVERHRLLWLYLRRETDLFQARRKMLHFAPERHARPVFKRLRNLDYVSADIDPAKGDVEIDIRRIAFDDATFDVILCSHVLEHIDDDRQAMRELFRVLKPGGSALIMTPYAPAEPVSLEDPTVTSREARLELFGNETHVRIYGRDLAERLGDAGFGVTAIDYLATIPEQLRKRYGLTTEIPDRTYSGYVHEDIIFRCVRPSAGESTSG